MDQWKNWVVYYSTLVLFDILPQTHLECWRHFVLGCRLLCSKELTTYSVQESNALLLQFYKNAEHLHGKDYITPNMHLHMHLKSCVLDYDPLHGFWLFAFERCNGELESFPNNNHSIEVQLMNRFIHGNEVISTQLPHDFNEELAPTMERLRSVETVDSLDDTMAPHLSYAQNITSQWTMPIEASLHSYRSLYILDSTEQKDLQYFIFETIRFTVIYTLSTLFLLEVHFNVYKRQSHCGRSICSSIVLATWNSTLFGPMALSFVDNVEQNLGDSKPVEISCATRIESIFIHTMTFKEKQYSHVLLSLSWFKAHRHMFKIGKPATVWCPDIFESGGTHSIVPVQLLKCRAVSLNVTIDSERLHAVCPCIGF